MRFPGSAALFALLLTATSAFSASLDESMREVEKIRGKSFKNAVEQKTITRSELREFLKKEIARSVGSTDAYATVLEQMLLVERDPKMIEKLLDLYEAQVLAFYDPEKHVYYSFDEAPEGLPMAELMERYVAIHELMHALQDQQFGVGEAMRIVEKNWDRELAYHAVIEGEATLVMLSSLLASLGQNLDDVLAEGDLAESMGQAAASVGGIPGDAPPFFIESMKFPYLEGLRFVVDAYKRGGWKAVDKLHAAPPMSTEEVMHPEVYRKRVGEKGTTPPPPPIAKETFFATSLGEFFWKYLLGDEAGAGSDTSSFVMHRGSNGNFTNVVESSWDTPGDATEFERAYRELLKKRGFESEVRRNGRKVRVVYGSDSKAVKQLSK